MLLQSSTKAVVRPSFTPDSAVSVHLLLFVGMLNIIRSRNKTQRIVSDSSSDIVVAALAVESLDNCCGTECPRDEMLVGKRL